jgi:hypothetical protein
MREAAGRDAQLKLTEDEVAFHDALEVEDSAVTELGEEASLAQSEISFVRLRTGFLTRLPAQNDSPRVSGSAACRKNLFCRLLPANRVFYSDKTFSR